MTAPSNANTSGLEACPFCDGEAWLNAYEAKYSDLPPKSRCPQCRSCGASLGYLATPAKATEAWNRRVTAASAKARIAELEADLSKVIAQRDSHWDEYIAERQSRMEHGAREAGYLDTIPKLTDRATAAEARADRLAKALKETRNRVREWPIDDHETCMCGSPVASHGMGDGHSPVSQGDHAISMIVEAINEALQQETQK